VSRDISRRFVIIFHDWALESYDDEAVARRRMEELKKNQLRASCEKFPIFCFDYSPLWRVEDSTLKAKKTA